MLYLFLNGHGGDILQNYILNLSEREKKKNYIYIYMRDRNIWKSYMRVCACLSTCGFLAVAPEIL